jgi:uncharacterized protein (TIGR02453 family)
MDSSKILDFLLLLKENNNREWFTANKKLYESALGAFEKLVNLLIPEIRKFDESIGMVAFKDCLFRIYRDVRFSADKTPYKTNFGAYIVKGGKKSWDAGYYIHIEPGASMLAGGLYMPPPEKLNAARQEIYYNSSDFLKIINTPEFIRYFGEIEGRKTSRPPKDFDPLFPHIELLKYKDYTLMHKVEDKILLSERFLGHSVDVFKAMYPFNVFFNTALRGNS